MAPKVTQKDWRKHTYLEKFQAAADELNVASHDIESLKFKVSTSDFDYRELLAELGLLRIVAIRGDYDGKAWKLTDAENNSIIIVEHETGLEIFYIVAGVASIIGVVPIVVNTWNRLRTRWPSLRGRFGTSGLERRRFDSKDRLIEEPAPPFEAIMLQHVLNQYNKLNERISSLESEVSSLKSCVTNSQRTDTEKKIVKRAVKK